MWLICWGSITNPKFWNQVFVVVWIFGNNCFFWIEKFLWSWLPLSIFSLNFFFKKFSTSSSESSCGVGYPWVFFLLKSFSKVFHFIIRIHIFIFIFIFIALYFLFNFYFYCFGLWWLLLWLCPLLNC